MGLADIGLFLRSARSDAQIRELSASGDAASVFDAVYAGAPENDPWASAGSRFMYQRRKYDIVASLIPRRRYHRAIDLGCGGGLFTQRLAALADEALGVDVSTVAVEQARDRAVRFSNLRFEQADIRELPTEWNGSFDLITVLDSLVYLPPPIEPGTLKAMALRLSQLARPGALLLLVNHYFAGFDTDSKLSRRIHDAFIWSPAFDCLAQYRRPFYLATLLRVTGHPAAENEPASLCG